MLSQLLNQMDNYLANKPFKRRWWSRPWIVHMTIQPPLSKDYPLWKRSQNELQLLRLFNLSPEELGQKIERYWEKPRWRRWFASFGINKKIDIWNYYQRCLAYQAVRPDQLEPERSIVIASESKALLDELALVLHQFNVKFETYLEKRCCNPKWIEKHFLKEIKEYRQQLKKAFLTQLNKSLKKIALKGDRFDLKQHAEQEYQQVEALMLHYFELRLNTFISRLFQPDLVPEIKTDVSQERNRVKPERNLVLNPHSQTIVLQLTLPRAVNHPTGITSLNGAKEWIQTQRQNLNLLIEEGSLQKVEALLKISLNEIKTVTELHLKGCESMLLTIQGQHEVYDAFLKYLDNLQSRLKPLLQGGMRLFHPDHSMSLTRSQAMQELITRYSQSYLEQSRCYLDRFKNYHLCLEEYYQRSQKELQRQQSLRDLSDLAQSIQKLAQSVKDLEQSIKELGKRLNEVEAERAKDKKAMEAERAKDKAELDARLTQYKAELDANMKEIMDLIKPQQPPSASDTDIPESSPIRYFKH